MYDEGNLISWVQNWFLKQCDGDWEHGQKITITNSDNPGWGLTIDLKGTSLENKPFQKIKFEKSENNWYVCKKENSHFSGDGGPTNLINLFFEFKNWVESQSSS